MPPPLGSQTKLYMNVESTPGQLATFSSSRGLRVYFTNLVVNESFDEFPIGYMPGKSVYGNYVEPQEDHIARSGYTARMRISFPKRCYGGHAVLDAAALGYLGTTAIGARYFHAAIPTANFPSLSFIAQTPIGDGTWSEFQFTGMRVASMRLRHQANDVLYQDIELMGTAVTWADALTTVPSTGNGFSPDPSEVMTGWDHMTGLQFNVLGHPLQYLTVRGWEMMIDNQARQFYTLNGSQKPAAPYRGGSRRIQVQVDVEMDDKWESFQSIMFGAGPDSGGVDCGITMRYSDPADTGAPPTLERGIQWDGDYQHLLMRWQGVDGPGGQFARLHWQTVRGSVTHGVSLLTWNETSGPSGWGSYGSII